MGKETIYVEVKVVLGRTNHLNLKEVLLEPRLNIEDGNDNEVVCSKELSSLIGYIDLDDNVFKPFDSTKLTLSVLSELTVAWNEWRLEQE
jgi:hypothetical protein